MAAPLCIPTNVKMGRASGFNAKACTLSFGQRGPPNLVAKRLNITQNSYLYEWCWLVKIAHKKKNVEILYAEMLILSDLVIWSKNYHKVVGVQDLLKS